MFLGLRKWLINKLAGKDIIVIINSKVYDYILLANKEQKDKNKLFRRNQVFSFENSIRDEVNLRIALKDQGIDKQGDAFILKKPIKERNYDYRNFRKGTIGQRYVCRNVSRKIK